MSEDEKPASQKANETASFSIDVKFAPEVLFQLTDRLRRAFRTPDTEGVDASLMLQERYIIALNSMARFTKDTGIGNDVAERLGDLATAMFDLREGIKSPVLDHVRHNRRSPDTTVIWELRALAVHGLECWIAADPGSEIGAVAKRATKKFPKLSLLRRDRSSSVDTSLLVWRDTFNDKAVKNEIAQSAYSDMAKFRVSRMQGKSGADLYKAGSHLLAAAERKAKDQVRASHTKENF